LVDSASRDGNSNAFYKIEFENKKDMERAIYELTNLDKSGNGYDTIIGVNKILVNMDQIEFLLRRSLSFVIYDFNKNKKDVLI